MTHTSEPIDRLEPIDNVLIPFQRFLKAETTSGFILLGCTAIALLWANSAWQESYFQLWQTKLTIGIGEYSLSKSLLVWINDALMAVFFFVVGLEIKREILVGELSTVRQAALPIVAAFGGMLVPAAIYAIFNAGSAEGIRGWGIPMATDIAFVLGVLALFGNRIPLSGKVFLTALAIVDDIGAALVIAVFYTEKISFVCLGIAAVFLVAMIVANRVGIRGVIPYSLLGLGLWLAFLKSGVHPTISGVLAAMTIPARVRINADEFIRRSKQFLTVFEEYGKTGESVLTSKQQRGALAGIESACQQAETPLQRLEHVLHPWVAFLIMPIFALANAGVAINIGMIGSLTSSVSLGIIFGLTIGKQIGIFVFAWIAVRLGIAQLPGDMSWRHVYGMSLLAGIGFTMSLFIATLAFGDSELLLIAKVGVLAGSIISCLAGSAILATIKQPKDNRPKGPLSTDRNDEHA